MKKAKKKEEKKKTHRKKTYLKKVFGLYLRGCRWIKGQNLQSKCMPLLNECLTD